MISAREVIFEPVFIKKPWGGKKLTGQEGVGEAFLISDFPDQSTQSLGKTISILQSRYGNSFLGNEICKKYGKRLPIYLKELDATDNLSIQVHPNDIKARELEGDSFGKSEAWYILNTGEGAGLYLGLKSGINKERLHTALEKNEKISDLLNFVPVKPGDCFYIPAGLVHALGANINLLEPQQNSNTTYRIWDWGRLDKDGNPRPLHIEKAMQVINFDSEFNTAYSQKIIPNEKTLIDSPYFKVDCYTLKNESMFLKCKDTYQLITPIDNPISISFDDEKPVPLNPGRACLIPALVKEITITFISETRLLVVKPY